MLVRIQDEIVQISRGKGALQGEQTELQATLQQAQTALRAQEVAIATHEGEFNALQDSQRSLAQKIETVEYEFQSLTAQEQEGMQKRAELSRQLKDLETREQQLQTDVAELTSRLEELRQQRETANIALTETKVELASGEQLCASLRQQQQPLEQRIGELRHLAEQRRNEKQNEQNRQQAERLGQITLTFKARVGRQGQRCTGRRSQCLSKRRVGIQRVGCAIDRRGQSRP